MRSTRSWSTAAGALLAAFALGCGLEDRPAGEAGPSGCVVSLQAYESSEGVVDLYAGEVVAPEEWFAECVVAGGVWTCEDADGTPVKMNEVVRDCRVNEVLGPVPALP